MSSQPIRPSLIFIHKWRYFCWNPKAFWHCIDSNTTEMFKAQKGCDISGSTLIIWSYKITFCAQKNNLCKNLFFGVKRLWISSFFSGQVVKINVCYWKEKIPGTYSVGQSFPCFIEMEPKEGEYDIYGLPSNEYPGLMKVCDRRDAFFKRTGLSKALA